jgi:glucan phosphoethanolaminetransferase (alkaline phosphatase superfamily)
MAWLMPSSVFLYLYVAHFGANTQSILAHLSLLLSVALLTIGIRLVLWRFLSSTTAKWLASFLICSTIGVIAIYYLVVLIGLQSWGRVVTSHLIENYLPQIPDLLRANGLPAEASILCAISVFLVLVALTGLATTPRNWIDVAAQHLSHRMFVVVAFSVSFIALVQLAAYAGAAPFARAEPVSLTLFSERATRWLQNNSIDAFAHIDAREDESRGKYVSTHLGHKRNVILIVGDALRRQNMAIFGYHRPTTPYLSSLKAQGRLNLVEGMRSVCAESSCGLLSTSRSKYVHEYSRRSFGLLEVLKLHGYRIDLILGGDHTSFYGLKDAYGDVDSYFDGSQARNAYANDDEVVVDKVGDLPPWDGKPTMIQLHLMSSHALGRRHLQNEIFTPASNYSKLIALNGLVSPNADEMEAATNYYDNGVVQLDEAIRRVISSLQSKGYLEDALVVVTGDHGELLGEHGFFGHQRVLEPALSVPFVLTRFGYPGSVLPQRVLASQVDIAPTIATELGIAIPATWSGVALQRKTTRTRLFFQQANWIGVYDASVPGELLKYVRDMRSGRETLVDLLGDERETQNLLETAQASRIAMMRSAVLPLAATSRGRGGESAPQ